MIDKIVPGKSHPEEILEWTLSHFPKRTVLTASFSGAGVALVHMLAKIDRTVPVVFLNTGFLFPETIALKDEFVSKYGVNVEEIKPEFDPGPLYETDTDACCHIRKVVPMERAMSRYIAWISALRRDQSATRRDVSVVEDTEFAGRPIVKVHPLATWTGPKVWKYIHDNKILYNPLHDQGYKSIGCWPCTRRTGDGEDERAGRWSGTGKTECGLHTR